MRSKYKIFILAVVFCLAVTSCGLNPGLSKIQEDEPVPMAAAPAKSVVLLIDSRAGDAVKRAAGFFADEILAKTDGALSLTVTESTDTAGDFLKAIAKDSREDGSAVFAFIKNTAAQKISGCFRLFSEPFLYRNYARFTMSVNSVKVYDELENMIEPEIIPLAGFYTGSGFLLSRMRIDDPSNFEGVYIGDSGELDPESIPVVMIPGNNTARAHFYTTLGATVKTVTDAGRRVRALREPLPSVAEFTFSETGRILTGDAGGDTMYLTRSFHNAEPLWLMADSVFISELAIKDRAVITEAVSALFDIIDGSYLRAEETALREMYSRSVAEASDFSRTRKRIRELVDAEAIRSDDEKRLLEYIYTIQD